MVLPSTGGHWDAQVCCEGLIGPGDASDQILLTPSQKNKSFSGFNAR